MKVKHKEPIFEAKWFEDTFDGAVEVLKWLDENKIDYELVVRPGSYHPVLQPRRPNSNRGFFELPLLGETYVVIDHIEKRVACFDKEDFENKYVVIEE